MWSNSIIRSMRLTNSSSRMLSYMRLIAMRRKERLIFGETLERARHRSSIY